MGTRQQLLHSLAACLTVLTFVASTPRGAYAQDGDRRALISSSIVGTLRDPTTYAPALLSYDATMRDWKTSQPFFQNGFVEHNARFTVTGLADDQAVSYNVGRNQILRDTLSILTTSVVQNVSSRMIERALLDRYPEHTKMVRVVGWIERISVASIMSYRLSAPHYRQWQQNTELAQQLGLR